ncbi:hypothetical protein ANTPLA_LOCUS5191 [Anthophora plagiata]
MLYDVGCCFVRGKSCYIVPWKIERRRVIKSYRTIDLRPFVIVVRIKVASSGNKICSIYIRLALVLFPPLRRNCGTLKIHRVTWRQRNDRR